MLFLVALGLHLVTGRRRDQLGIYATVVATAHADRVRGWGPRSSASQPACCSSPAPNDPRTQFDDRMYAPPTRVHIHDAHGFHKPFIYKQILEHRLMRRYANDRSAPVAIEFFTRGRLMSVDAARAGGPLLILGADALGRDIFSRLVLGARLSLGVALVGVLGAILIGAFVGSVAGTIGGRIDDVLMTISDFVLVLPGAYLVLVLRGVLPLVLSTSSVFWLMATLFAATAWPHVARGVRAIVAAERAREYAEAARAAGAGPLRLAAQLLPAARGFLGVEIVLLLPALLIAEATISFLGLGFPAPVASWGTMLQDAANVNVMSQAPWMLAPAAALFLVVLGVHLVTGRREEHGVLGRG